MLNWSHFKKTASNCVTASKFDESMIKFEISIFYIPFESNWFRSFFLFLCVYWNVYIALFDTRLFLAIQINYNIQRKKKKCKIVRCKKCENMKIETLVGRTKSNWNPIFQKHVSYIPIQAFILQSHVRSIIVPRPMRIILSYFLMEYITHNFN